MSERPLTILCIASYEKGQEFMRECKRQGCRVFLLTSQSIADANWPRESLDNIFFIPDENKVWKEQDYLLGVSYLARTEIIDRIVALDDYDVEKAATLREHLRFPGMGETTSRYFRDKLAMRMRAKEEGIRVPDFVHVLNYDIMREFISRVSPPWLLKPRSEASAIGIKKVNTPDELWAQVDKLGDRQSYYVLEQYIPPADIYHVDSIVSEGEVIFASVGRYGHAPMEISHTGGVFTTRIVYSDDGKKLQEINRDVQKAMGLVRGVSHTEFLKGKDDGQFYFLETSARVGGAHIVELVEMARGINLWAEWAKIEISSALKKEYHLLELRNDYAGLIVSLAKQEYPDTSAYNDPEVVWRLKKLNHAGLIVRSQNPDRIEQLLKEYSERFYKDFFAALPPRQAPTH